MAVLQGQVPIMLTEGVIAEYEDVLSRPSLRQLTGLSPKQNTELVLAASAIIVTYNVRHFAKPDLKKYGWEVMTPIELATLFELET